MLWQNVTRSEKKTNAVHVSDTTRTSPSRPGAITTWTCTIELPSAASHRTRHAYELIWTALEKEGIRERFIGASVCVRTRWRRGGFSATARTAGWPHAGNSSNLPAAERFPTSCSESCGLADDQPA